MLRIIPFIVFKLVLHFQRITRYKNDKYFYMLYHKAIVYDFSLSYTIKQLVSDVLCSIYLHNHDSHFTIFNQEIKSNERVP